MRHGKEVFHIHRNVLRTLQTSFTALGTTSSIDNRYAAVEHHFERGGKFNKPINARREKNNKNLFINFHTWISSGSLGR